MNKYKALALIIALILPAVLSSCNGLLDKQPDDRVTVNSPELVRRLLINAYPTATPTLVSELSSDNIDDYDFVYIADIGTLPDESIQSSDTIICIKDIYNNSKRWNRLKRIGRSKIFIDFFDFGIIFAKNNFQTQIYKITF